MIVVLTLERPLNIIVVKNFLSYASRKVNYETCFNQQAFIFLIMITVNYQYLNKVKYKHN